MVGCCRACSASPPDLLHNPVLALLAMLPHEAQRLHIRGWFRSTVGGSCLKIPNGQYLFPGRDPAPARFRIEEAPGEARRSKTLDGTAQVPRVAGAGVLAQQGA